MEENKQSVQPPRTMSEVIVSSINEMKPERESLLAKFAQIKASNWKTQRNMRFGVFHWIVQDLALSVSGGDEYVASGLLDSVKQAFPDFYRSVTAPVPQAPSEVKVEKVNGQKK